MPGGTIDMALPDLLAPEEAPSPEGLDARIEPAAPPASADSPPATPPASADSPPATPPDAETARFIALLHTQGPAWFKMWSLELQEQPERLPEILSEVTVDPIVLVLADDPRRQEALVRALQAAPAQLAALGAQPVKPAAQASDPAAERPADGVDTPDWLGLRQKWNDGGGA